MIYQTASPNPNAVWSSVYQKPYWQIKLSPLRQMTPKVCEDSKFVMLSIGML